MSDWINRVVTQYFNELTPAENTEVALFWYDMADLGCTDTAGLCGAIRQNITDTWGSTTPLYRRIYEVIYGTLAVWFLSTRWGATFWGAFTEQCRYHYGDGVALKGPGLSETEYLHVALDFSKSPVGRLRQDGPYSGERFREDFLVPALRAATSGSPGGNLRVLLDGTVGYGSAFLEEAFGGLIRVEGFSAAYLHETLTVVSVNDPSLVVEIWGYIDGAGPRRLTATSRVKETSSSG